MSDIISTFDYSKLDIDTLLVIFKSLKTDNKEKYVIVLNNIIKKYFEDKSQINIFYFLQRTQFTFLSKLEILNLVLKVFTLEFEDNSQDIPVEYQIDFFSLLLSFLKKIDEMIQSSENNISVEFELYKIPKLLKYLSNMKNLHIVSISMEQELNNLVKKIKRDFVRQKRNVKKKNNVDLIPISDNTLIKTEEKLEEIKTFKLKKSKLTKTTLIEALGVFELYNEEDKISLIEFMIKKGYFSSVQNINSIFAFDFFKQHLKYSMISNFFNPFEILKTAFFKMPFAQVKEDLYSWLDYFECSTVEEMFDSLKEWYLSFDDATVESWSIYLKYLLSLNTKRIGVTLDSSNEIVDLYRKILKEDWEKDFQYLQQYKGRDLISFCETVRYSKEKKLKELPIIKHQRMVESLEEDIQEIPIVLLYFQILERYKDFLYSSDNFIIVNGEQHSLTEEIDKKLGEYTEILTSIKVTGNMITEALKGLKEDNRDIGGLEQFIQAYFCLNCGKISKETIKSIWYVEENLISLYHIIQSTIHGFGDFSKIEDYSIYFFNILKDDLNFSNIEDLKLFFRLPCNYYIKSQLFKVFFEKFKVECKDCYGLLQDYMGSNIEKREFDEPFVELIKAYYKIKE